jgi:hypothetical protein
VDAGELAGDLGAIATLCLATTRCLPTTVTAQGAATSICVTSTPETEPNQRGAARTHRAIGARAVMSTFAVGDAEDCHAPRMPAGSALYVESTLPVVAQRFRASGVEVGRWTLSPVSRDGPLGGSARLDPASIAALRDLVADDSLLCVRSAGDTSTRTSPATISSAWGSCRARGDRASGHRGLRRAPAIVQPSTAW